VVFTHQFSSIAGAGPVTGPIIAAMFGWLPVLLWILFGGIFFGAVHDFGALYASVKNEGKPIGCIIEQYIGRTGKKLFLLFSWIFSLLVIAAFADIVATTFNGFEVGGKGLFPTLFVTIACGAVSGFHSLVSSGTSSKQVQNERDMLGISFGAMLLESLLAVIALVAVGSVAVGGKVPAGTPFSLFASAIAGFLGILGIPKNIAICVMTMFVSALAQAIIKIVGKL
jgi:carbon starvation protein CstA